MLERIAWPTAQIGAERAVSGEEAAFEGPSIRPSKGRSGSYYHGLPCDGCGQPIAVFPDQSKGKIPLKMEGNARLRITCPHCAEVAIHPAATLKAFCHP